MIHEADFAAVAVTAPVHSTFGPAPEEAARLQSYL
jgi:hypothetical protein